MSVEVVETVIVGSELHDAYIALADRGTVKLGEPYYRDNSHLVDILAPPLFAQDIRVLQDIRMLAEEWAGVRFGA